MISRQNLDKADYKVEILAPAGSYESFLAAVHAGADAVYAGGPRFGARAYAENFTEDMLKEAMDYAHLHGRRFYLTVNTLVKDSELFDLKQYLEPLYLAGLDAVIVQDPGVFRMVRRYFPEMEIHASTQMTITGTSGAQFLQGTGGCPGSSGKGIISGRDPGYERKDRNGNRMLCAWSFVLLLFRTVSAEQSDRRTEREQRAVCAALQASLLCGWRERIPAESKRYLYLGSDS